MHEALYEAYDNLLLKDAEEKKASCQKRGRVATAEDILRRNMLLERKRQKHLELPAFCSMLEIGKVEEQEGLLMHEKQMQCEGEEEDGVGNHKIDGFERMRQCRLALDALDVAGWKRSYHQRLFHEAYIAACARPFWKLDPPGILPEFAFIKFCVDCNLFSNTGSFARAHQKILDFNNWDNLAQEILISTPRRFGKTISVSMFAAALMFSCAGNRTYFSQKPAARKLLNYIMQAARSPSTPRASASLPSCSGMSPSSWTSSTRCSAPRSLASSVPIR